MRHLFSSPEFYPLRIDFDKEVMSFVRMSRESYYKSVFLDTRTRSIGSDRYEVRLDDLLLAAANTPPLPKRVHYILHPTFCCSTLLARYFETLPFCFVLKEPLLLTQLALIPPETVRDWDSTFDLAIRLLTRTFAPDEFVVIKPHEPCNVLAARLLQHNQKATITFMTGSLRQFLLAVLKAEERRRWVRTRVPVAGNMARCPSLLNIASENLTDAEAAAYLWLVNQFLCQQLASGQNRSRVLVLDGQELVDSPRTTLRAVLDNSGLPVDDLQLRSLVEHPSVGRYSKDLSRAYNAESRSREMAELEERWGVEADIGVTWASSRQSDLKLMLCNPS